MYIDLVFQPALIFKTGYLSHMLVSALYCSLKELTLLAPTIVSSSKMQGNAENACKNGKCAFTVKEKFDDGNTFLVFREDIRQIC